MSFKSSNFLISITDTNFCEPRNDREFLSSIKTTTLFSNLFFKLSFLQNGEIIQDTGYASQTTPDLHGTNQEQYDVQQQHWNQQQTQAEYNEQPISLMEVPAVESSEWQPSLASVQEPYNIADRSDQYAGANVDTSQYQQVQQQDYWNQQAYNQQNYSSQDYNNSEWQQQPPSQYTTDQPEVDNNQQHGKWGYEVK